MTSEDVDRECTFLREQAAALGEGLRYSDDPACLATALTAHDASHEHWLHLLAHIERTGPPELAEDLSMLYEFHGRLVESLERGLDGWINTQACYEIRTVLADRLTDCTDTAVAELRRLVAMPQPL
jgi:hypothetical protein